MLRTTGMLTAVLIFGVVVEMRARQTQSVDVTGAWEVTITMPAGSASGLAILSQDGSKVTGMIGPAETDMMQRGIQRTKRDAEDTAGGLLDALADTVAMQR